MDHNWRQQFFDNEKALAAKKGKGKSITEKEKPIALPTIPPLIKKDKKKERCKHCGSARHVKKLCYYLMLANQRLDNWESYYGKEHLLLKNLANA